MKEAVYVTKKYQLQTRERISGINFPAPTFQFCTHSHFDAHDQYIAHVDQANKDPNDPHDVGREGRECELN